MEGERREGQGGGGGREGGERGMDVGHGDKNQRGGANKLKQNKHLDD